MMLKGMEKSCQNSAAPSCLSHYGAVNLFSQGVAMKYEWSIDETTDVISLGIRPQCL